MDKNHYISKLNKAVPGAVLESRRFGRSGIASIWVEIQKIQQIASALKADTEFKLDWLENLSVVEFEEALVLTYFVRSYSTQHHIVVRGSIAPASPTALVTIPSIRSFWPMGEAWEREAEEMFGIEFQYESKNETEEKQGRLMEGWKGFPLRKSYVFPKEVLGITHSRPFNRPAHKK